MEIPDHFLNKNFVEVRQENVDEFFALRGFLLKISPWILIIWNKWREIVDHFY